MDKFRVTAAVLYRVVGVFCCFFFFNQVQDTHVSVHTHICSPWNPEPSSWSDGFRCQSPSEKVGTSTHWPAPNPVPCALLILSFGGGWGRGIKRNSCIPALGPWSSWCLGTCSWACAGWRLELMVLHYLALHLLSWVIFFRVEIGLWG